MPPTEEFVVGPGTSGKVRRAGSMPWHQEDVKKFKEAVERSLFAFSVGVLGRHWLSERLHKWVCDWLQRRPPHRKMLLLPRLCCKTTIGSHCLPLHILIQPEQTNVYFPGLLGTECRILLAGEKETRATDHLRVIQSEAEGNKLLRALWPEAFWDNARRQSKKWNEKEMIFPRPVEYPDPTLRATGVGGAITGARPNVIIKDDLISLEAANSDLVMQGAIDWHTASRALLDLYDSDSDMQSLEFLLGTHWAAYDLYSYIEENDATVEVVKRSIYEINPDTGETEILWPERYTWDAIEDMKRTHRARFWLMYMNQPMNEDLADFDLNAVRRFAFTDDGQAIDFDSEARDDTLERVQGLRDSEEDGGAAEKPDPASGQEFVRYSSDTHDRLFGRRRGSFFNDKYLSRDVLEGRTLRRR